MSKLTLVTSGLSLCLLSQVSLAQGASSEKAGFLLAAGTDAVGFRDGSVTDPGLSLQFGYERPFSGSRIGLRLAGSFHRNNRDHLDRESRLRSYGAGVFSTFALSSTKAFRPYLIGGVGVERTSLTRILQRLEGDARVVSLTEETSASFSGGAGLLTRLGGASLFAEARPSYLRGGSSTKQMSVPITLGLRF